MLITYNDGTDNLVPVTDIQPSDAILVNKTFSLTGTNTATGVTSSDRINMPYKVGLKYTSTFSDGQIHYYIKRTTTNENVTANYVVTPEDGKTKNDYLNQTIPGNDTYTGYTHGTLKKGNKYTEMVTGEFRANQNEQSIEFNLIIQFPDTGENQDSEKGATINGKVVVNYEPETIAKTLSNLDKASNGLEVDDTPDKNLRYVGASPKNYINFNNETWRIVGVFNNITSIDDNDKEKKESFVKIIRNASLGNYSWDSSASTINSGYSINEWSQADLMTELNTDYIDTSKTSGTTYWYNGRYNLKTVTYDYSKNIKSGSIDKVAKVRWNLGGYNTSSVSALNMYNAERGTEHISNPSDGITRTNTWDGKIALMYPSDYGYASTGAACRNSFYDCDDADSKANNWLFNSANQWTLSPISDNASIVFNVTSGGFVRSSGAYFAYGVRPALFLKFDVVIAGGTGTESDPFILELSDGHF